jgi:hypothetical protein
MESEVEGIMNGSLCFESYTGLEREWLCAIRENRPATQSRNFKVAIQQLNFWGTNMLKSLCSNNAVMFYFNRIPLLNGRSEQGANRSAELTAEAFRNEDNAFLPLRRRPLSVR